MIVTCPSCRTRYRPPVARLEPDSVCTCSRCAESFSPVPLPRRYRLVAASRSTEGRPAVRTFVGSTGPGPASLRFGMDDPSLADKVERTSLDGRGPAGEAGQALTYRVVAGDSQAPEPAADVEVRLFLSLEGDDERVPMIARLPAERERRLEPEEPPAVEDGAREPARVKQERGRKGAPAGTAVALDDGSGEGEEPAVRERRPSAIPGAILALGMGAALAAGVWFGLPELGWQRIDLPWGLVWDLRWISGASGALGVLLVAMVWRWRSSKS